MESRKAKKNDLASRSEYTLLGVAVLYQWIHVHNTLQWGKHGVRKLA
jgi:hypothetical protein